MSSSDDVLKIGKKLDKIIARNDGADQALDLLRVLQSVPINLDVLQKTRIGMTVNKLRKNFVKDEEVTKLSKTLIKNWKQLLNADNKDSNGTNSSQQDGNNRSNNSSPSSNHSFESASSRINNVSERIKAAAQQTSSSRSNSATSSPSVNSNNIKSGKQSSIPSSLSHPHTKSVHSSSFDTTNEVRLKCRELLVNALKLNADVNTHEEEIEDINELAIKIEDHIYREFKDTTMKYKNRVFSRVSNLKDIKNPELKWGVLRGEITPARISVMTAEEMASDNLKKLREQFTKEAINDHQMSFTSGTASDLIKCPKCKKSNTTYNQVQTRSADEPMTTFCLCNECGKRWKFC